MVGEKTGALATLREIVDGILLKSEIPEGKAVVVKQLVIDGYRELNLVVSEQGRVMRLFTMDENLIINLPDDLLVLKDIYVPKGNGIWSLTRRKDIPILTETVAGSETIPEDWGEGRDISHGEGIAFQTRGGRNLEGYYTIDLDLRRIHFRNVNRSEVLLDYNTSGINRVDYTYIPMTIKPALEAYVLMECAVYGILPKNEFPMHERRFEKQKGLLRMIDFNFTEFTDAVYQTMNGSYRR